jgi:hypothetical protein
MHVQSRLGRPPAAPLTPNGPEGLPRPSAATTTARARTPHPAPRTQRRVVASLQSAGVAWRRAAKADAKASAAAAASATAHTPLPPGALALLATLAQIYPPSDFRHPVLTPMSLLMGEVRAAPRRRPAVPIGVAGCARHSLPDDENTNPRFLFW